MERLISGRKGRTLSDRTTSPTVKHGGGGNLMLWGGVVWVEWMGKLIEVQGNMDKVQYCEILRDGVEESLKSWRWCMASGTFQQDNDPNTCLDWLHSGLRTQHSSPWLAFPIP